MKKLTATVVTAFLMSTGLVAAASAPASAGCTAVDCTTPTSTDAIGLEAKAPHKARVFVKVGTGGDESSPGRLDVTFVKNNGDTDQFRRRYSDAEGSVYGFKPLSRGRYDVIVSVVPRDDSTAGRSDTTTVRVKGQQRRR